MGFAFALWIAAVAFGMKLLLDYQVAAGAPAAAPRVWPAASRLGRLRGRPTLVMTMHPRCPCSRATMTELARIVAHADDEMVVHVLIVVPDGKDDEWAKADIYQSAIKLPGVHVLLDDKGVEARKFGAVTSGQALYYDAVDSLRFAGGITPGRGHAGDNMGESTIVSLAKNRHDTQLASASPVFGCELATPIACKLPPRSRSGQ